MNKNIEKLWILIRNSNRIILINHIRMDMDAFWWLASMYDILKLIWKEVIAVNDEKPIDKFSFLWYNEIIEINYDIKKFNPDLIISLDAASLDQLWDMYKNNIEIFDNKDFVAIDHHKTNPWFAKLNIIDVEYSSTCELVFDILKQLNLDKYINSKIATVLLSWIYTDTNIFYNSNTTKNTYNVAWELLSLWADFRKPYFEFYMKKTYSWVKLWWEILANHLKSIENWKIAYVIVTRDIFEKTSTNDRQLEWLVSEFFSNIEWVEICFIWYELKDWWIKFSFRSSVNYDISKVCEIFWWWWHKQAAWFTSYLPINDIEEKIINEIKKELI